MVTHIVVESDKLFKGKAHEKDWLFGHDALSLLTAHDTVAWMKLTFHTDGRSYYDLWLKPEHLGTYYPGNSPEMMNWDSSLNKDVDDVVGRHVSYCRHLVEGDEGYETRFSRHTLQEEAHEESSGRSRTLGSRRRGGPAKPAQEPRTRAPRRALNF
jgi:hypothetical protein